MAILIQYANGVPGVKFALDKSEITIGRALSNDISIDDEFVSKKHAVIQLIEDEVTSQLVCILIDNDSTNNTYVNNVKVTAHQLDEKDKIYIGQNEFRYSSESISPVELNTTRSGFFADDAPGFMHAKVLQATLPTTPFQEISPLLNESAVNLSKMHVERNGIEDTSETKHLLNKKILSVDLPESGRPNKSQTEDVKRFSRRLSLI